ncbi:type I-C CRISPR-associated protein Cas5c [Bifidobacterium sp. ESL0800]|uniref:type I-C CRISPR-associated protein Cas5c n=1 Tax=Bifidobacterium sp. ESL0800 TaxID=2983236 RepID=UPI0023F9814F|nr:type I-C CRISPR-associated protein Cas5c [Bifidobacterium sp. ESL0800]WEV76362.1 type I-C CRISPR-associated protein Cas5c [Bifidobacterium sp. ESL0800]
MKRYRNSIEFEVFGPYALFSEVATRTGGEKFSYQVPTYQALKGITESVYWKPTLIWRIDAVRVMNRIQTESKGIRPIKYKGGNDLSYYTYLKNVRYQVLAHFEWNEQREDLAADRNENKHHNIAKRAVKLGGRRDIFLGTRECQGYVEPCEFGSGESFYDGYGQMDMGYMFHSFIYPDENPDHDFTAQFWRPVMSDGVIEFPRPDSSDLDSHIIRGNQPIRKFEIGRNLAEAEGQAS